MAKSTNNKMNKTIINIAKSFVFIPFLIGCETDGSSELELTVESGYVSNIVDIESITSNTIMLIDEFMRDSTIQATGTSTLYNDIIGELSTNNLTITYGKQGAGTTNPDGTFRRGKITASFQSGQYQTTGSVVDVNFSEFRIQNKRMNGSLRLTNKGLLPNGHEFEIELDSLSLDSNHLSYKRYLIHSTPFTPLVPLERIVLINSIDTGKYYDHQTGMQSSLLLITPISWDETCQYRITDGVMDVVPDSTLAGTDKIIIDYIGDSDCANLVRGYSEAKDQYFFLPKRGF